eukprot:m.245119 g.245119  ORF g.245119 m.245119 type:complete len:389 (+) comp14608_c0_seq1:88-1254(+)
MVKMRERQRQCVCLILLLQSFGMISTDQALAFMACAACEDRIRREEPRFTLYPSFNLEAQTEYEVQGLFRFARDDIVRIFPLLNFPPHFTTSGGTICNGLTAFLIMLARIAQPMRWTDLAARFGPFKPSQLSEIFYEALETFLDCWQHLLDELPDYYSDPSNLRRFATAVYGVCEHLRHCCAFLIGTPKRIARPTYHQRLFYSEHERYHCLKFQNVSFPDGIIGIQCGPIEGRRTNQWILNHSGLIDDVILDRWRFPVTAETTAIHAATAATAPPIIDDHYQYGLYGASGYDPDGAHLMTPSPQSASTLAEQDLNTRMLKAAQWSCDNIVMQWASLMLWSRLRNWQMPVGKFFKAATLLANMYTCIHGSETGEYFQCKPPPLEQYLSW